MRLAAAVMGLVLVAMCGCRSAYVEADVKNASGSAVQLVEVDYPSASFGVGELAAGAVYHYRFKVLGSGAAKAMWTDGAGKEHSAVGPVLREGEQGVLTVTIAGDGVAWSDQLTR